MSKHEQEVQTLPVIYLVYLNLIVLWEARRMYQWYCVVFFNVITIWFTKLFTCISIYNTYINKCLVLAYAAHENFSYICRHNVGSNSRCRYCMTTEWYNPYTEESCLLLHLLYYATLLAIRHVWDVCPCIHMSQVHPVSYYTILSSFLFYFLIIQFFKCK